MAASSVEKKVKTTENKVDKKKSLSKKYMIQENPP